MNGDYHNISRRGFIKGIAAAGFGLVAQNLLAGCTPGDEAQSDSSSNGRMPVYYFADTKTLESYFNNVMAADGESWIEELVVRAYCTEKTKDSYLPTGAKELRFTYAVKEKDADGNFLKVVKSEHKIPLNATNPSEIRQALRTEDMGIAELVLNSGSTLNFVTDPASLMSYAFDILENRGRANLHITKGSSETWHYLSK